MTRQVRPIGTVNWIGLATLLRRELRRYMKEAWETVAAPAFSALVYFVVFAFALGPDRGTEEGRNLLSFVVPGLIMMTVLLRAAETTAFSLLFDKMEGIISDVLSAPLGATELTVAYSLAGAVSGLATGLATFAAALLIRPEWPAYPLAMLGFAGLGAVMFSLWGILIGLWGEKWDHMAAAFVFVTVPVTFLSGIFVPVEALPEAMRGLIRVNPVYHAIDGFRFGMLGASDQHPALSAAALALACALLWLACRHLIDRSYKLRR